MTCCAHDFASVSRPERETAHSFCLPWVAGEYARAVLSLMARAFSRFELMGFCLNRSLPALIALLRLIAGSALAVTYSESPLLRE